MYLKEIRKRSFLNDAIWYGYCIIFNDIIYDLIDYNVINIHFNINNIYNGSPIGVSRFCYSFLYMHLLNKIQI